MRLDIRFIGLGITDVGAEELGSAIPHIPTLRLLDLAVNEIGAAGARAIANGSSQCQSLTSIVSGQRG